MHACCIVAALLAGPFAGPAEQSATADALPNASDVATPPGGYRSEWIALQKTTINGPCLDGPAHLAVLGRPSLMAIYDPPGGQTARPPQRIVVAAGGRLGLIEAGRLTLLGSGKPGHRDGPAEQARLATGGAYSNLRGCAITADAIYLKGQARIGRRTVNLLQRIYRRKSDGRWWVQTVAGLGTKILTRHREQRPAGDLALAVGGVAADTAGDVYCMATTGLVRIRGATATMLCTTESARRAFYATEGVRETQRFRFVGKLGVDRAGNVYGYGRTASPVLWRVGADGTYTPLAGYAEPPVKWADGKAAAASFHCPMTSTVGDDGTVYIEDEGGGARKIVDGKTYSLARNGRWVQLATPDLGEKRKHVWRTPSGNAEIHAVDRRGNLYCTLDYGAVLRYVKLGADGKEAQ